MSGVNIVLGETIWIAEVDLTEGKVVELREITLGSMESLSGPERKVKSFHINTEEKGEVRSLPSTRPEAS